MRLCTLFHKSNHKHHIAKVSKRGTMSHRSIKLTILIIYVLYFNVLSYTRQRTSHISLVQAFLFQHTQPISALQTSHERSNLSYIGASYDPYKNHLSSDSADLGAKTNKKIQQAHDTSINFRETDKLLDCPIECECNSTTLIADCSNRNLDKIPTIFPRDIKRINLQRNNISELRSRAFQGLKRLQRIDLSNNNLLRIDPSAFAGGLQSLNSLILYSNKLSQLPVNLFDELTQLQLLLLNDNSLQCIHKELFNSLENLNLLSLYDNNIETLFAGTFDGLKNIRTIHLGKNPLVCDCNLRWLAEYLEQRPNIETSEARCDGKNQLSRNQGKRLNQVSKQKFKCEENYHVNISQCATQIQDQSCPPECNCVGSTIDCSRTSSQSLTESRVGEKNYAIPDVPDDVPVYVAKMRINDQRIKRIRQTGLFRRLANSQKLDLGNTKIIDIEDNAISGGVFAASGSTPRPERLVFVLVENNHCDNGRSSFDNKLQMKDGCSVAPKVNPPDFDNPCYNGGSCVSTSVGSSFAAPFNFNYTCLCPPGFSGHLCEINIDDCAEHQCQNGALCVDGVNSYKCICRDPSTTGEFCEQLNSSSAGSANSIAPVALPMVAQRTTATIEQTMSHQPQQQLLARSVDHRQPRKELSGSREIGCKRVTQRKYYDDGNGCQSVRVLKMSECVSIHTEIDEGCCMIAKIKRRKVRMQCSDGASYVKTVGLVKKCAWSSVCNSVIEHQNERNSLMNLYNFTQRDRSVQTTSIDD